MSLFNSNLGSEKIREVINRNDVKIFFIGMLGAGMLPLSRLMRERGAHVFGNDRAECRLPDDLCPLCPLSAVSCVDLAVYSLAISEDDADVLEAKSRGIPLVSRAELIGEVMLDYPIRIGIAGTHGKSTSVAIMDTVLRKCGLRGVTVSGASLACGTSYVSDGGDFFLFEACEYKNSFHKMHPTCAVVTNAELDHADFFKNDLDVAASFTKWVGSATDFAVIGRDSPLSEKIISECAGTVYTISSRDDADFVYKNVENLSTGCTFYLYFRDKCLGTFSLSVFGEHNVMNASVAIATAYLHGVDVSMLSDLTDFHGIDRRQEYLGTVGGRAVYYDYAHHPTEIRCALRAIKAREGRVSVIFRPHTYTRTLALWDGFADALRGADSSVILDIYPARESPVEGVSSSRLAEAVGERCVYLDFDSAVEYSINNTDGAIVLMGAGDVDVIKQELIRLLDR